MAHSYAYLLYLDGYGAFTVSRCQMETVRRYIAGQEAHHGNFQEEFLALLKAHEIAYDEQYIWK
jgi:putative transposase